MSRTATQTDTAAKVDLLNAEAASGANVVNQQRETNSLNAFTGRPSGSAHNATPTWVNNDVGVSTDHVKQRADLLTQKFNLTTGHKHTGASGDAPQLTFAGISTPLRGFEIQGTNLTGVTGGTHDVSSVLSTKSPSTSSTIEGIPVSPPENKVFVRFTTSIDPVEDAFGNQVYGRLTNSGGVGGTWTLTFFVDIAGVETAYSFSGSNNISWWYQELFHPLGTNRPVYSQAFLIPSDNAVADVVDATATQSGKVNTSAQNFGGEKNFDGGFATERVDVATAATITALTSTKSFVRFTGSTATSLQGISAPASGQNKRLLIHNASTAIITIEHQHAGASAADRIVTPGGTSFAVNANHSLEFIYEDSSTRWVVVDASLSRTHVQEIPSGTINGSNTAFTLAFTPISNHSVNLYLDGLFQSQNSPADYSITGTSITFTTAPATGQILRASYTR